MNKTVVVKKEDNSIEFAYAGEPNQQGFGGPWSYSNIYTHQKYSDYVSEHGEASAEVKELFDLSGE